jgi:DNA-binding response OmpR family regulator
MGKRSPLCILLVEDDKDSLSALSRLLRLSGHRPLAAASAEEAVRLAAAEKCDLVVSDVGLPDRSGLDLMRELSATHNVPGIAVSGYTDAADVRECAKAGFARHLKKPIDFDALLAAVEELTRGAKPAGGGDGAAAPRPRSP